MNSHQKDEKVRYDFGIECFWILPSNWSQTFRYLRMRNSVQNRISAAQSNSENRNSYTVDRIGACE
jgi:hypothetical protein